MFADRTNLGTVGRWWWTIDRFTLAAILLLVAIGAVLVAAASPAVALRIGVDKFYFVQRQYVHLAVAMVAMFGISLLSSAQIRRFAIVGFFSCIFLLILVPFFGSETKGATRWLYLAGVSIQPSEFLKPFMAVTMAWVFALKHQTIHFPGFRVAIVLYALVVGLLLLQPDIGMTVTISAVWGMQFFLAGLPFFWVILLIVLGLGGLWVAYLIFPHVTGRIDRYLDPNSGDNYQVGQSLKAFENGGFLGRGPGEGNVKQHIPDSHTDYIFSVAGEEFGVIICIGIVGLFAFIVLRNLVKVWNEKDLFVMLAVTGLIAQFGIQAIINMGVATNLLPAKGMTLPFLSYGGSSLLAVAIGMGMLLALTKRRYGAGRNHSKI